MEELKAEATKLGLDFKGNISKVDLQKLVDEAKNPVAKGSPKSDRVKVIVTPRDSEEKEGYVGLYPYNAQYEFDEEIDFPAQVVEFIKSLGGYVTSSNGEKKWQSRYIVEIV